MSSRLLYGLNHARLWQRSVLLWDCRVRAASLDRLLFLALHRAGWMGAEEVPCCGGWFAQECRLSMWELTSVFIRSCSLGWSVSVGASTASNPSHNSVRLYGRIAARTVSPTWFRLSMRLGHPTRESGSNAPPSIPETTVSTAAHPTRRTLEVTVVRIDDILPVGKIDFVKIDVQGHELGALAGMDRSLSSNPGPPGLLESLACGLQRAGNSPESLLDFFRERDFLLYETAGRGSATGA